MAKHFWFIYNGMHLDDLTEQGRLYAEAGRHLGLSCDILKSDKILPVIEDGKASIRVGGDLSTPDFVIFYSKDTVLARHLETVGLRVFNGSSAIEVCDDKARTHAALAGRGIPMAKTIFAPRAWGRVLEDDYFDRVIGELGLPMVVKNVRGSYSNGVFEVKTRQELVAKVEALSYADLLFQEVVTSSYGRDLRIEVAGDRVVTAFTRQSGNGLAASIHAGGSAGKYQPSEDEAGLAIESARLLGMAYAGVDILWGADGRPLVNEVNSNPLSIYLKLNLGIDPPHLGRLEHIIEII